jgi:hypothetical protein
MTEASPSAAPASGLDRVTIGSGAATARPRPQLNPRAIITGVVFLAIIGLAIWYLARSEPLLVLGEIESTRIGMAGRVSGRREKIAVARGQNVAAGATLLVIDNPGRVAERDHGKERIRRLARDPGDRRFRSARLCVPCSSGREIHGPGRDEHLYQKGVGSRRFDPLDD